MTKSNEYESLLTRRDFLKKTGRAAAFTGAIALGLESILTGCATVPPTTGGHNPYYKGPGSEFHSFMKSIHAGWSPGVDWMNFGSNTQIVATATGKIRKIGKVDISGHTRGYWVDLKHGVYRSVYAHVNKVSVNTGQKVNRGDIIGYGGTDSPNGSVSSIFKFMLKEYGNLVNPNNYGQNHSFMQYWDGSTDLEIDDVRYRLNRQHYLMEELLEHYVNQNKDKLQFKKHRSGYYGTCYWSDVEKFWYLEKKYQKQPELFPNLTDKEVSVIRSKFYDMQSIVLTLPFKKH